MPNPRIEQGTLNRLRGSVSPVQFPELNIIAGNLAPEGISISFGGGATTTLDAMTGVVQSPEPFLKVMVKIHLLKSQALSDQWKSQMEESTLLGDLAVTTDTRSLSDYYFGNSAIESVDTLDFSGKNVGYVITLSAIYYINNSLWDE